MDSALFLARLLVAIAFAVAAVAKLADLPGTQRALHTLGLPRRLARLVAVALPVAEVAVAVALLSSSWAWRGALGALAVTLPFIVLIARRLARERTPNARRPGRPPPAVAGWLSLARMSVLAAVAAFILWQGREGAGPSMLAWVSDRSAFARVTLGIGLMALALVAAVAWLVIHLLSQNGRLMLRIEALEAAGPPSGPNSHVAARSPTIARIGQPAPAVTLPSISGGTAGLHELLRDEWTLVLFWNPACRFCANMLDDLRSWHSDPPLGAPRLLVISTGTVEANRKLGLPALLLLDQSFVAGRAVGAAGTPAAVLIDAEGKIASEVAVGAQPVMALARTSTHTGHFERRGSKIHTTG